ncbi:MAG: 4Fe-4S dicluster domain-containing protein [Candidatus Bathyarchaeota archaeon]|nr:4Fe-4S dicluster domain-containing protein [Candidatus Bathyarchaeota archaeon]
MAAKCNFQKLTREENKVTVTSLSCLAKMQKELKRRSEGQEFDEAFTKEILTRFKFTPPPELKDAQSLIIVAMPRSPKKAIFDWKNKKHTFIVPPIYSAFDEKRMRVEQLVTEAVGQVGFRTAPLFLPLKLLAVSSGLARYGRNNIAYVEGMGSFVRFTALYSDMPSEETLWQEAKMLDQCIECDLCRNACPTGAIDKERFLLHQDRCLTYHNEKDGKIPFPEWIKPQWHNCLVGCTRCQTACPENKSYIAKVEETVEFTQEDTTMLLKGTSPEQAPRNLLEKIKQLGLTDYFNEMPRNLSALLEN